MKKFEMPEIQVVSFSEDIMIGITTSPADANYIVGSGTDSYSSSNGITPPTGKFSS